MVATEAIEGRPREHFFDEFRNRAYIPPEERCIQPVIKADIPKHKYASQNEF